MSNPLNRNSQVQNQPEKQIPSLLLDPAKSLDVRYKISDEGEVLLNLKDAVVGLGFENEKTLADGTVKKYIRWERVNSKLTKMGKSFHSPHLENEEYLTLPEFYELSSYAESKAAMAFKKKVNTEILPSIFYTGAYVSENATPDQVDHLMENQVILFCNQGGERPGKRIGQMIDSFELNNLRIMSAFDYIYERLKNKYRSRFRQSFKYALDEAYDRALMAGGKKKKIALEAFRTKAELLFHIERVHHKRDNYSHGQKYRRIKDKLEASNQS